MRTYSFIEFVFETNKNKKKFSGSLGGRDYDSMSGSLGVRGANSGAGAFTTDFRSGLGDY